MTLLRSDDIAALGMTSSDKKKASAVSGGFLFAVVARGLDLQANTCVRAALRKTDRCGIEVITTITLEAAFKEDREPWERVGEADVVLQDVVSDLVRAAGREAIARLRSGCVVALDDEEVLGASQEREGPIEIG